MVVSPDRSGKVKIAALVWLLVLAAIGYCVVEIGGVYWRQMKLEEAVKQRLAYAGQLTNESIRQRIYEDIVDLNLPPQARDLSVIQTERPRALRVNVSYQETVNLLFTEKKIPVRVEIRRRF